MAAVARLCTELVVFQSPDNLRVLTTANDQRDTVLSRVRLMGKCAFSERVDQISINESTFNFQSILERSGNRPRHRQYPGFCSRPWNCRFRTIDRRYQQGHP